MSDVYNWFETIQCSERPAEAPEEESALKRILAERRRFPSPIRPVGSLHSMTECIAARVPAQLRWGTLVSLRKLAKRQSLRANLERDPSTVPPGAPLGTVTVPAGRTFIEVARELRAKDLQLRVNTELGSLTMGAAACGATKDSSFPGEPGQVCHDVVGMRLIKPSGEIKEFREGDPDFEALRCSYGLFGIVTEVTFRVFKHEYISIRHEELEAEDFEQRRQEWLQNGEAVFLYLFPYARRQRIIAELRRKSPLQQGKDVSMRLRARNYFWREGLHRVAGAIRRLPHEKLAHLVGEVQQKFVGEFLKEIDISSVSPVAQLVDFEKLAHGSEADQGPPKFTFSMWAFPTNPEHGNPSFARILDQYFAFCRSEDAGDFRTVLPQVSYHISRDTSSLLSYSHKSDVWTLDPIASGEEAGWNEFLKKFNDRCSDWGGTPLFNQTPHLERRHVVRAFGDRLARFEDARRRFDPDKRMLNDYFANLLTG